MKLDVKAEVRAIERDLRAIEPLVTKATVRSLNRSIKHFQSQSVKSIASHTQLKQKVIHERTRLYKASRNLLKAAMKINLLPIRAMKLKPRQTKAGVTANKCQFPSAFIANMPSGHQGVFKRAGKKRLPIREVTVPMNPPAENLIHQALSKTKSYFKKELERDLAWRLRR